MKKKSFYLNVLIFIVFTLSSCKKEEVILQVPEVTTFSVTEIAYQTATCGGYVNSVGTGITSRGICLSTKPTPTISDSISTVENENGSFSITLNNLKPDSTYYVRAYANNSVGIGYGSIIQFKMKHASINVITATLSDVSYQSATCGGSVTCEGISISACGICWSTKATPTLADSTTIDKNEPGSFTSYMKSLKPNLTYYVRAYATNGLDTIYGSTMIFKTKRASISVTTTQPNMNLFNTLQSGGTVTTSNGVQLTGRGICWSLSPYPTIDDSVQTVTSNLNNFSSTFPSLKNNTLYYLRAFASTNNELIYGDNITFKTRAENLSITPPTITVTPSSFICGGTVTSSQPNTVIARGICWNTTGLPTINDNKTSEGTGNGYFESTIMKQSGISTYYIRTYATDSEGTVYGDIVPNKIGVPTVQTISITKSGTNYPILKGQIVSEGNAPTTDCGFHIQNVPGGSEAGNNAFTANPFSFTLYNLSPGRTYFIRAYAKNSIGIAYGNVIVYTN